MTNAGILDLSAADLAIVQDILARCVPDRPIFVFGSRANGRAQRRSDLDLAIGGSEPLSLSLRAELVDAFDESDLPIEVDVVDLTAISETFHKRIMSEWIPLVPAADRHEVHA